MLEKLSKFWFSLTRLSVLRFLNNSAKDRSEFYYIVAYSGNGLHCIIGIVSQLGFASIDDKGHFANRSIIALGKLLCILAFHYYNYNIIITTTYGMNFCVQHEKEISQR
jgi:hypothetical protein